jgi:hypothetical protein
MSNGATVIVDKKWHPAAIRMPHGGKKTIFTAGLADWGLFYVDYGSREELDLIRKALYKAELTIMRVTEARVYFEEV